jgi:hypothetical protein
MYNVLEVLSPENLSHAFLFLLLLLFLLFASSCSPIYPF